MAKILKRHYNLGSLVQKGKVLVVYGPRRVGKTTLLNGFLSQTKLKYKLDSGDNIKTQEVLNSQDFSQILEYVAGYELLAVDEAQHIFNVGMGLKILVDERPGLIIIATGSSSFDLVQQLGEPLTGRKRTILLYPFSQMELLSEYNQFELKQKLEEFLVFGSYPEVIIAGSRSEKIAALEELVNSYLLKDILTLGGIKGSRSIFELLKLLAFQIGSEVSLNELAAQVKLDIKTVDRYLDILEKSFVIKKIGGFSRNLRKEITAKSKYYFFDNGVRNGVVSHFNDLSNRNDAGLLFENFIVIERIKKQSYKNIYANNYFWRTYDQKEIDWVEERNGKLFGYEIKWGDKRKKEPKLWRQVYKEAKYELINRENYLEFIK